MSANTTYRDNLRDVLDFFDGKRMLTVADVRRYTGLVDYRTVRKKFPFVENMISAPTLARCLSGGKTNA